MVIFYLLILFAALPIIAYLLSQKTNNKGLIFGATVIVLSFCLIIFTSKFAILGNLNKQTLTNKILDEVYLDSNIPKDYLINIEKSLNEDEIKTWMISLISKSIDLNKLNSAESFIVYSEKFFVSNEEKIIFYSLYTSLRDAKFPKFRNASLIIDKGSYFPCVLNTGLANLFILNGPDIPIAKIEFQNTNDIRLRNENSIIPGFDLASAYLNNESLEMEIEINCKNSFEVFSLKSLIILNENNAMSVYKINSNEWSKKSQ